MGDKPQLTDEALAKLSAAEIEALIVAHVSESARPLSEGSGVSTFSLAPASYREALQAARAREKEQQETKEEMAGEAAKETNPFAPPREGKKKRT